MLNIIDSRNEIEMGLGRHFSNQNPLTMRQAYISEQSVKNLGLEIGNPIEIYYDWETMAELFASAAPAASSANPMMFLM